MNVDLLLFIIATLIPSSFEFSIGDLYSSVLSPFCEQCDTRWVIRNIDDLEKDLYASVFGQDLALNVIIAALSSHISKPSHKKPLVLNFHGWPGGGKSYVADFIVKHWFRNGYRSKFVKKYFAKIDFPLEEDLIKHQRKLQKDLADTIYLCPRAIFVFDEVDKYPPYVLDGIKPYLDYNTHIHGLDYREAIFIFITNTGEELITKIAFEKWQLGVPREDIRLRDFEEALRSLSYNDKGGFYRSDLIKHHLIDFVVPFMPLERPHVESCIKVQFELHGGISDQLLQQAISEIMEEITFGPSDDQPLYPKRGCKNIDVLVQKFKEGLKYNNRHRKEENEL